MVLSAAPGTAYAVKPLVGAPSFFVVFKLFEFSKFSPPNKLNPRAQIRREDSQSSSADLNSRPPAVSPSKLFIMPQRYA